MDKIPSSGEGKIEPSYTLYKGQKWVHLYCSTNWYYKVINMKSIPYPTKEIFHKAAYRIQDTPFNLIEDFIEESNKYPCTLNFALNVPYNYILELFSQKKPIYMKQKFDDEHDSEKIKQKFNTLFMAFITNIERTNDMYIPIVVRGIIKKYIKVGYAVFYCKDFEIP